MNRLAGESSLYLRQHGANPVDWYPWSDEAFAKARAADLPILLSVGYSACHWCHVMAHECFEDAQLATLQNQLFVSIKVDREERPDIDRVYMEALQALTGSGGWPMTVFLLPDGRPFFAGTYFPKQDGHGLPGFRRVMEAVAHVYRTRREDAVQVAGELTEALSAAVPAASSADFTLTSAELGRASSVVLASLDSVHGGFGAAPKFPQAPLLEFLLARAALDGDREAGRAVRLTLAKMAGGGIQDQIGGGFHRYAVDASWAVPHFEKMLYDQAQLISCYLHLWLLEGVPDALSTARATADFAIREMRLPHGGFAASLDADTPTGEGSTYLWSQTELEVAAGKADRDRLHRMFRFDPAASIEGRLVLQGGRDWADMDNSSLAHSDSLRDADDRLRGRLLEIRGSRPQPERDDKVVVAWNALMVSALAELGVATAEAGYLGAAELAGRLLLSSDGGPAGHLSHLVEGARGRIPGTLEDHAAAALAGLQLHEATGDQVWFDWALSLAERADRRLREQGQALWYDVAKDQDPLLRLRPMGLEDSAMRSGNSLMVEVCLRLYALTADIGWEERAAAALAALGPAARRLPAGFSGALFCAQLRRAGLVELALITQERGPGHRELLRVARAAHRPNLVVAVGVATIPDAPATAVPPLARGRATLAGRPTAHVCRAFSCRLPTNDAEVMAHELGGTEPA